MSAYYKEQTRRVFTLVSLVSFFLLLGTAATEAQTTPPPLSWEYVSNWSGDDSANSIRQTSDAGYITAGAISPYTDFSILKLASSGRQSWFRWVPKAGTSDILTDVQEVSDGNYVVVGLTGGSAYMAKMGRRRAFPTFWEWTYGDNYSRFFSVQETTDGGFIVSGAKYNGTTDDDDVYLVRTDSSGAVVWQQTFALSDGDDVGYSVEEISGGYMVAGTQNELVTGSLGFLLKTDATGNPVLGWPVNFGGSGDTYIRSARQTSDGGFIAAGSVFIASGNNDIYLCKLDGNGVQEWEYAYGYNADNSGNDEGRCVRQTADGGYVIAGVSQTGPLGGRGYLVKTDGSGVKEWQYLGDAESVDLRSVVQAGDGGFVAAGSHLNPVATIFERNTWVIKLGGKMKGKH